MTELPECLRDLPIDPKRKLPIPYMNQRDDGEWDFLSIYAPHVVICVREGRCGICGKSLGYASAFVGGPMSATNGFYSDPPFHPECAKAAMRLCPHILIGRMKRASEERVGTAIHHPTATMDKPKEWVISISPTRETQMQMGPDGLLIKAGRATKRIRYPYGDDGNLTYPANG